MEKPKQQGRDDCEHFDGVFIGPNPPPSVFFRGFKNTRCISFRKTSQIADQMEADRRSESERKLRAQRERGKQRQKYFRQQRRLAK